MKAKWFKALVSPLLVAGLLLAPIPALNDTAAAAAQQQQKTETIRLWVDGAFLKIPAPIYKENGVLMAPANELLGALKSTFVFEKKTNSIIIRDDGVSITMAIGKKEAFVNGKKEKLSAGAVLKNNVVFVPIRYVGEKLDASVAWDGTTSTVKVKSWKYKENEEDDSALYENKPKWSAKQIVDHYDGSVVMIMTNTASGSGIVIGDNLVLTNYHVIEDATSATANTIYGTEYDIKGVVAYNEKADLAIVRTTKTMDLIPVEIGYKYQARKGDRVFALGSPLGIQNTVSEGLISNLALEGGVNIIQTNAQIDHGSSGGALFNEYGELVGVTFAGISGTQADLNFAIEAYHAAILIDSLTDAKIQDAKFFPPLLPESLKGAPLADIKELLEDQFSYFDTSEGEVEFQKWDVKRDAEGWLVFTANIDPLFYLYYGTSTAGELKLWGANLAHEFHRMLPDERIQVIISFERDYTFQPRGLKQGEVTSLGEGKWRVRYPVLEMQFTDQLYIQTRA
ncbi:trypsin-like peptidase domain-containing protein [Paenibacillus sp. GCM10027627]|uniref:trypsin-like peptidase domain-containing protein n=1 Tax=unclassified Paenibacillus TaxID=185978 RepID=UPI0036270E15